MSETDTEQAQHGRLTTPRNNCSSTAKVGEQTHEWMSSFLTEHQHILGYLVPYNGEKMFKMWTYNQGYLATINVKWQNAGLKIKSDGDRKISEKLNKN